jgi:hypothetical protein
MGILSSKSTDVAAAEMAFVDAQATVAQCEAEVTAAGAEHADLLSRSGAEVLDDPAASGRIADLLVRLDARHLLASNAVVEARRRVEKAQRNVLVARAADVRTRAARLRTTAAVRQRKTDRLLAGLEAHGGCTYLPPQPLSHPAVLGGGVTTFTVPWTALALQFATSLDKRAAELERLAAEGTAEQVAAAAGRPMPDAKPVESLGVEGVLVAS